MTVQDLNQSEVKQSSAHGLGALQLAVLLLLGLSMAWLFCSGGGSSAFIRPFDSPYLQQEQLGGWQEDLELRQQLLEQQRGDALLVHASRYLLDSWLAPRLVSMLLHLLAACALAFCLSRYVWKGWPATLMACAFLLWPGLLEIAALPGLRTVVLAGLFAFVALALASRQLLPMVLAIISASMALSLLPYLLSAVMFVALSQYLGMALALALVLFLLCLLPQLLPQLLQQHPLKPLVISGIALLLMLLGFSFSRAGNMQSAQAYWQNEKGEHAADKPRAAVYLAWEMQSSPFVERRKEASVLLQQALPKLPPSEFRLAAAATQVRLLQRQDELQQASQLAAQVVEQAKALANPELHLAACLLAAHASSLEGDMSQAKAYVQRARAMQPEHPRVLTYEAMALLRSEQPEEAALQEAEVLLQRALHNDPHCYAALLAKGRLKEARGSLLQAVSIFNEAIELRPMQVQAHIHKVKLFLGQDMTRQAEQALSKAMGQGLDHPYLHYCMGLVYFAQGRRDEAREYFEAYLRLRPLDPDGRRFLATVLAAQALNMQQQWEPQVLQAAAERIRELDPHNAQGLLVQAASLGKQRRFQEAVVLLESAAQRMGGDLQVQRRLAQAYRDRGWQLALGKEDAHLALDYLRKFIDLAPADLPTEAARNKLLVACKQLEKSGRQAFQDGALATAESLFRRSTVLLPQRPQAPFSLGAVLLSRGRHAQALASFESSEKLGRQAGLDVGPDLLAQVDTLQRMEDFAEAKRRGQAFLAAPGPAKAELLQQIRDLLAGK